MILRRFLRCGIHLKVLCSKVLALFISWIGATIYVVLPVSFFYLHNDMDTVTFVLMAVILRQWSLHMYALHNIVLYWEDASEPVEI